MKHCSWGDVAEYMQRLCTAACPKGPWQPQGQAVASPEHWHAAWSAHEEAVTLAMPDFIGSDGEIVPADLETQFYLWVRCVSAYTFASGAMAIPQACSIGDCMGVKVVAVHLLLDHWRVRGSYDILDTVRMWMHGKTLTAIAKLREFLPGSPSGRN